MLLISLFCIPVYILYAKGQVFTNSNNPFLSITIGNMHGATIQCFKSTQSNAALSNGIHLSCPSGTMMSFKDIKYGMLSDSMENQSLCLQ